MINFLSGWVKNLSLAVIIVTILEMILPNNKTKKYIKMVMGIYILFSIIYPFTQNSQAINLDEFNVNELSNQTNESSNVLDQTSMDKRLNEIYIEELEKDIMSKIENKGYCVNDCNVDATIINNQEETGINKIKVNVCKNTITEDKGFSDEAEEKLVTEVQKIQKVNVGTNNDEDTGNQSETKEESTGITKTDIQIIKSFLSEEYGVSEKCLEIN